MYTSVNGPSLHHRTEIGAQRKGVKNTDPVSTSIAVINEVLCP